MLQWNAPVALELLPRAFDFRYERGYSKQQKYGSCLHHIESSLKILLPLQGAVVFQVIRFTPYLKIVMVAFGLVLMETVLITIILNYLSLIPIN